MASRINTVIIDDSDLCITNLQDALKEYSEIQITGSAKSAEPGKKLILAQHPDLMFLDVEMPDMSGIELLRSLHDQITWPLQVVFYTAYDKYLLEALRESAFDYLLKPFEKEDLRKVIDRYFIYLKKTQNNRSFHDELQHLFPANSAFLIATYNGFQVLRLEQIGYFKYQNNSKQWTVVLSDLKELQLKRNTNAKDILKYSQSFVQINRDQIININYLSIIKGKECVLLPPFDNVRELNASSSFLRSILDKFNQI